MCIEEVAYAVLYPEYFNQLLNFFKLRIAGYYNSLILYGRDKDKTVGIRNAVLSFIFCCLKYQVIGYWQNCVL